MSLIQGDRIRKFNAIRQSAIDMAVGMTTNWSLQVEKFKLFCRPPRTPDYVAADALARGVVGKDVFKTLKKVGLVPLARCENGYRQISNSK